MSIITDAISPDLMRYTNFPAHICNLKQGGDDDGDRA
jgi:hypothetical protein